VCDACQKAKSHQLPYPKSFSVSTVPLQIVFSDVWGPALASVGRYKYYVSFIDDYSKFTWIYLLKNKSDVFQKFHDFQHHVERLFDKKILALQTDWGGEYHKLNSFFQKVGISHHVSCPHAHQQNGSAERKHRHIVEVGLSLLAYASMPLKYWDEAFSTVVYLINRLPSKVINSQFPFERFSTPNLTTLSFAFLALRFGLIFVRIILVSSSFAQNNVSFLGKVTVTRVISVLISPLDVCIFLGMSCLMSLSSRLHTFILMPVRNYVLKSLFCHQTFTYLCLGVTNYELMLMLILLMTILLSMMCRNLLILCQIVLILEMFPKR
jgi:hypothetical protein